MRRDEPGAYRSETPEQTLARLAAATAPAGVPGARFTVRLARFGYAIDEVDAFVSRLERASADKIRDVTFSVRRFGPGYDIDEVDGFLERAEAARRQGAPAAALRLPRPARAPARPQEHGPEVRLKGGVLRLPQATKAISLGIVLLLVGLFLARTMIPPSMWPGNTRPRSSKAW